VDSTGISRQTNAPESEINLLDRSEALSRVDGDGELLCSLVDIFFKEAGPMMVTIREAVTSHDPHKLEKSAHRLKGSVSVFAAHSVSQTAFDLEKMGRASDLSQVANTLARLEQQMTALQLELKQFHLELQTSS